MSYTRRPEDFLPPGYRLGESQTLWLAHEATSMTQGDVASAYAFCNKDVWLEDISADFTTVLKTGPTAGEGFIKSIFVLFALPNLLPQALANLNVVGGPYFNDTDVLVFPTVDSKKNFVSKATPVDSGAPTDTLLSLEEGRERQLCVLLNAIYAKFTATVAGNPDVMPMVAKHENKPLNFMLKANSALATRMDMSATIPTSIISSEYQVIITFRPIIPDRGQKGTLGAANRA